jgi:hypothetical protein
MSRESTVKKLNDLEEGRFYRVLDLESILKNSGISSSIFIIRDYETWKCQNYKCGKRHDHEVSVCEKCGGPVRSPLIASPRTRGGGKGPGHRRYSAEEIRQIVEIFKQRS